MNGNLHMKINKIDYEYEFEITKSIADWIAKCPVKFRKTETYPQQEVVLTLTRERTNDN